LSEPHEPDPIREAADAALRGELIVIPTDTVYGIGTVPDDPRATAKVFAVKGRPRHLVLPVLVPSLEAAGSVAVLDERAERLVREFWPGALTLVLPRTSTSRTWDLGEEAATIGVRLPDHEVARAVLEITGPLAVTSANPSGVPPITSADLLESAFGDSVAVYLCEEAPLEGRASTVVDLTADPPRALREGDVSIDRILRIAAGDAADGATGA
jgi:tRNA threonylcarbamoyl adenosine modification protein (Sua5/YciO/YrdC/YwlC family)